MYNNKIQWFISMCESAGVSFIGIEYKDEMFWIMAHDSSRAGKKPVLLECRDEIDYTLLLERWNDYGKILLSRDKNFDAAISSAIENLKLDCAWQ